MEISQMPSYSTISFGKASAEKQEEMNKRTQKIKRTLQGAAKEERKLSMAQTMQQTGLNESAIRYVIRKYSDIGALWKSVQSTSTTKGTQTETEQKKQKLESVLSSAKDSKETLTMEELSERSGVTVDSARYQIASDDDLDTLWFWTRENTFSHYTKEEIEKQIASIKRALESAIDKKKVVTNAEIGQIVHLDKHIVSARIVSDSTLSSLRKKIDDIAEKNRRLEIASIKKVLKEAEEKGLKITQQYISQTTTIPVSTVDKRIDENAGLKRLFEKVRAQEHTSHKKEEIAEQNAQVGAILAEAIQNGQKMTMDELAARLDGKVKSNTLSSRINENKTLKTLWDQVKTVTKQLPTQDEIKTQTEKIEKVLTELKAQNKKTTLNKLAKAVNLTSRVTHSRIQGSKTLSALWQVTCSKPGSNYSKEETEVHCVMIERILQQRIQDKMKPTPYQMAQYLDLSEKYINQCIEKNENLSALWKQAQENT